MIIALHGGKGSGKNTVAVELKRQLLQRDATMVRTFAFATILKQVSALVTDVPLDNFYDETLKEDKATIHGSPREIMTDMADALKSKFGDYIFAMHLSKAWLAAKDAGAFLIVTDLRHKEEAATVLSHGGVIVPIYTGDRKLPYSGRTHISELPLGHTGMLTPFSIDNSLTLSELPSAVADFLTTLKI